MIALNRRAGDRAAALRPEARRSRPGPRPAARRAPRPGARPARSPASRPGRGRRGPRPSRRTPAGPAVSRSPTARSTLVGIAWAGWKPLTARPAVRGPARADGAPGRPPRGQPATGPGQPSAPAPTRRFAAQRQAREQRHGEVSGQHVVDCRRRCAPARRSPRPPARRSRRAARRAPAARRSGRRTRPCRARSTGPSRTNRSCRSSAGARSSAGRRSRRTSRRW